MVKKTVHVAQTCFIQDKQYKGLYGAKKHVNETNRRMGQWVFYVYNIYRYIIVTAVSVLHLTAQYLTLKSPLTHLPSFLKIPSFV